MRRDKDIFRLHLGNLTFQSLRIALHVGTVHTMRRCKSSSILLAEAAALPVFARRRRRRAAASSLARNVRVVCGQQCAQNLTGSSFDPQRNDRNRRWFFWRNEPVQLQAKAASWACIGVSLVPDGASSGGPGPSLPPTGRAGRPLDKFKLQDKSRTASSATAAARLVYGQ